MDERKFEIPQAAADAITIENLRQWRDYLVEELETYRANPRDELNPDGVWMHPEDVVGNEKYIRACNLLILAFGGDV